MTDIGRQLVLRLSIAVKILDLKKYTTPHVCFHADIARSRSTKKIRLRNTDLSRPAFQFQCHSRSLEPTRTDLLPMTF